MSWLNINQSLNSIKGQITNFASEVLLEGSSQDPDNSPPSETPQEVKEIQEKCRNQELEIQNLRKVNEELEAALKREREFKHNGGRDEASWYWDPPQSSQVKSQRDEISSMRETETKSENQFELARLREENKILSANLEELDSQHQLSIERILTLKKELQKNFEVLKQEHEDLKTANEEYQQEINLYQSKLAQKDKEVQEIFDGKTDYTTLHHKYQNLEKVHSLLRENTEKFQEENQELHEEVFKLQEQITKLEHDNDILIKNNQHAVSREKYEDMVRELNNFKDGRRLSQSNWDEMNIDDNAKGVIEKLNREIQDLKHKISYLHDDAKSLNMDKVMRLYTHYVNFELPDDDAISNNENYVYDKLENSFKALSKFKKEKDAMESKLVEQSKQVKSLQSHIEELRNENDYMTSDITHYEKSLSEMKKNNDFLIAEIAALRNTSKLEPILETNEDNIVKLETELADCTKLNKNFAALVHKIEKELAVVQSEKGVLQNSLDELKQKYSLMLTELENFKTESKEADELEKKLMTSEQNLKFSDALDQIDKLKSELIAYKTNNEKAAIELSIIENDKVLLIKEIADLKEQISSCSGDIKVNLNIDPNTEVDIISLNNKASSGNASQELQQVHTELLNRLEISKEENAKLKQALNTLKNDIKEFEAAENNAFDVNEQLKMDAENNATIIQALENKVVELETNLTDQVTLKNEITNLKMENKDLVGRAINLENQLSTSETTLSNTIVDLQKTFTILEQKTAKIDDLNSTVKQFEDKVDMLLLDIKKHENSTEAKTLEVQKLHANIDLLNADLKITSDKIKQLEGEKTLLKQEKDILNKKIMELEKSIKKSEELTKRQDDEEKTNHKSEELIKLKDELQKLELTNSQQKDLLRDKDTAIDKLKQKLVKLKDVFQNLQATDSKQKELIKEKDASIEKLNQTIIDLQNDTKPNEEINHKNTLQTEIKNMTEVLKIKDTEITELNKAIENHKAELNHSIETLNKEKAELISLVTLKHNESVQYHAEIQRLNELLINKHCDNCTQLQALLKERDSIINQITLEKDEILKNHSKVDNQEAANDTINALTEKCENLKKNLSLQLEVNKNLTAEKMQLADQEITKSKELDRLRRHLVELEENHTQELMSSEQKLVECQTRLHVIEERSKQNSTVYTSNSIRSNQEIETLRNQIKLLENQRNDVQIKFIEMEDANSRCEAALTNLQLVLQQFQSDKDRDIEAATEKLKSKMAAVKNENGDLRNEIAQLKSKLEETMAGLQAASRLGEQLESKSGVIIDLKEQVRNFESSLAAAHEKYHNSITNQHDRVDKNLVKNLVVNYVQTEGQSNPNRTQMLRLLSTVLDFNQQECEKLGLTNKATQSLAREFVSFLEKESRRSAPPQMVVGSSGTSTPVSRKNSGLGPQPNPYDLGHRRNTSTGSNNLLFQPIESQDSEQNILVQNPLDSGVNQTRNNEGAILKHVLKDM